MIMIIMIMMIIMVIIIIFSWLIVLFQIRRRLRLCPSKRRRTRASRRRLCQGSRKMWRRVVRRDIREDRGLWHFPWKLRQGNLLICPGPDWPPYAGRGGLRDDDALYIVCMLWKWTQSEEYMINSISLVIV